MRFWTALITALVLNSTATRSIAEPLYFVPNEHGLDIVDIGTVQAMPGAQRFWQTSLLASNYYRYEGKLARQARFLHEIDCQNRRIRRLQTHYFDEQSFLLGVKREQSGWDFISPETLGWRILTFVCKVEPPEENSVLSGLTVADAAAAFFNDHPSK